MSSSESRSSSETTDFVPLLVFGVGMMGGALLRGALAAGWPAALVTAIDPAPSPALLKASAEAGFALNPPAPAPTALALLAIKPQMLDASIEKLRPLLGTDSILVSIMAGKSIADIRARLPHVGKLVRAMPNTPAAIGRGITGAFGEPSLTSIEKARVQTLLETTGKLEWLDREDVIDVVTAISGSGPAYVFLLVEALAKAGEALGLPPALAMKLARSTVEGAGELLHRDADVPAATLRRHVTSPGGTTAAAMEVLLANEGLEALMIRAAKAAHARAKALAG